jgi:hypothetical protein
MRTAQVSTLSPRTTYAEADQGTLLGLYHGYDQARISLAKLVNRFGTDASSDAETRRRIWARAERQGLRAEIFDPPCPLDGTAEGINQAAHTAALSAFATMSEKAEELLRTLRTRWPELGEDAGGPLPAPAPNWWVIE